MYFSSLRRRSGVVVLGLAALSLLSNSSQAQLVLADSAADFSGVQGQDDWTYGYRNLTADGGGVDYNPAETPTGDFIPFAAFEFDGAKWDLGANAPWTEVGVTAVHPNGTNNVDEHWAIRRWTAPAADLTGPTLLQIDWSVVKNNANGTGVTGQLHLNGVLQDSAAIAGTDTVGVSRSTFLTLDAGDILDLACTPVGPGGDPADGSDGSATSMVITTVIDSDSDSLPDSWEETYFPGDLTALSSGGDNDGDGLLDEEEFAAGTNPSSNDSDGDGYSDLEEVTAGTNPNNSGSLPSGLADSRTQFSGVDGQDGWRWGYRNFTQDGNGTNYDAENDFIPFPVDGSTNGDVGNFWNGAAYDWYDGPGTTVNPPWTFLAEEGTHPNGTNNGDEHWTVRRWTASGLGSETPIRILWHTRKTNANNDGVTGSIHLNGTEIDSVTIAGNDATGFVRAYYVHLNDGDIVDQVLTPEGVTNRGDGSDGSANWMRIDDRLPAAPQQPNGKYFVPNNAPDIDGDGLADFWEEVFFPGDLTALASDQDFDGDGSLDQDELTAGSDPTNTDSDGDGLSDGEEATAGSDPLNPDSDGDGISDGDEVNGTPPTSPILADTDGDGFSDPDELAAGSDPNNANDTPLTGTLADSRTQFSGVDGQDGWRSGYRNVTLDGGGTDYDPVNDFIPFAGGEGFGAWDGIAQQWTGTAWDLNTAAAAPWTFLADEGTHPNGTNNGDEHWTVRRYTASGLNDETPVGVLWHTRKTNLNGDGVTGSIHLNGQQVDSVTVAGNDGVGFERTYYLHLNNGDVVDLILSPVGVTGTGDGADGSANWMRLDTRLPEIPIQPNGSIFIPNNSPDTDNDGLADFWERFYAPGDLSQLATGQDFDNDGLLDEEELARGTDPTNPDSDGDGLSDGGEIAAGTDPFNVDTDGDCFSDFHEVATGYDPLDEFANVENPLSFDVLVADSRFDFPFGASDPQGEFGWTYGYYNITQDGEPPLNTNLILFPTDGTTTVSENNFWDGDRFDWQNAAEPHNPPWTEIAFDEGHPNGDNNGDVHWAVRRWTVNQTGPLAVSYHLRKTNPAGNGTTAVLIHNGRQVDSITVAGNDTVGLKSWSFIDAQEGDTLEVALTPRGVDGLDGDGADGSAFWLLADNTIPPIPFQPDGSIFGASGLEGLRIVSVDYNATTGDLTFRWTSDSSKEYLIEELTSTSPVTWTPVGPTITPQAGGETQQTLNGIFGDQRLFHVLELDP